MDFEMDCDYIDDSIEEYLKNKLKLLKDLIKSEENITKSLELKIDEVVKNKLLKQKQTLKVNKSWKYVYEYKFILGFELQLKDFINEESDINILLEFNPPTSPLYKIEKFKVDSSIIFILVIENLEFTKYCEYNIKGVIRSPDNEMIIEETKVRESDFYDRTLSLNDCYADGSSQDFFSFLALNNEIILKCKTERSSFDNLINLKIIEIEDTVYYLIKDEMLSINGNVFKLNNNEIHIYYRNKNHLIIFLHYLFKNVKEFEIDLSFMPQNQARGQEEDLEIILENLVKSAYNFHKNTIEKNCSESILNEEYKVFREELMKHEHNFNVNQL